MSTPELPQPIYPGAPPASSPTPAPATNTGTPDATRSTGYAPIVPGAPGGGPGSPGGRTPGNGRWLLAVGAGLVVVVIAAGIFAFTRGTSPRTGANPGATSSQSTDVAEGPSTTPPAQTADSSGGAQSPVTVSEPAEPDVVLVDTVAGMWSESTAQEQACVLEQASGNSALADAITAYYYDGSTSTTAAQRLAAVNVACLPEASLEAVLLDAPITPTCDWYDFSSLTDSDWRTLLADAYLTMAGLATRDEFAAAYFPGCTFED